MILAYLRPTAAGALRRPPTAAAAVAAAAAAASSYTAAQWRCQCVFKDLLRHMRLKRQQDAPWD